MAQIIIVNYNLNWWKGLFLGTVVFTTFCIVKEIPPISGDFYDTIFLKKIPLINIYINSPLISRIHRN